MTPRIQNKVVLVLVILFTCSAISIPAFAHHGTAIAYDANKSVTLRGTVTEFVFKNPHIQIYFDVTDEKGNVVHWAAECGGVFYWSQYGWRRDSLKPGDPITITLHPSKAGKPVGENVELVLASGKPVAKMGGNAPIR